jgi:ComF family protein
MDRAAVFTALRRVFGARVATAPDASGDGAGRCARPVVAVRDGRWPSTCLVCRAWPRAPLCDDCLQRHAMPRPRCPLCAIALAGHGPLCGDCSREAPAMSHTEAAVDYCFPWNGLLNALKHHEALDVAPALATLMLRQHLGSAQPAGARWPPHALLLPVPMTTTRLRARGHNPAWELARRLAPPLGLEARAQLLRRVREAPPQQGLDRRARLSNLAGAFAVDAARRASLAGRPVVLVDDVMTTGATLGEATRTLLDAGARSVQAWVLARTPLD